MASSKRMAMPTFLAEPLATCSLWGNTFVVIKQPNWKTLVWEYDPDRDYYYLWSPSVAA